MIGGDPRLALQDQIELLRQLEAWRAALPRLCFVASAQIERADVTPKELFVIPAGYEGHALVIHGETGSNAGGIAVLDIGRAGAPAAFVAAHSVLGLAGEGQRAAAAKKLGVVSGAAVMVTGRYTETGTPSNTGGPWTVTLFYSKGGN